MRQQNSRTYTGHQANVVSVEMEDGSYVYDVLYKQRDDSPILRFPCANVRDAANLADALNDHSMGVTVHVQQERIRIQEADTTLLVLAEGDRAAGIAPGTYQIDLPEIPSDDREGVARQLGQLYSDLLGLRISTLYNDQEGAPTPLVPYEKNPTGFTGQQLYERYVSFAALEGLVSASWSDLEVRQQRAWQALADHVD